MVIFSIKLTTTPKAKQCPNYFNLYTWTQRFKSATELIAPMKESRVKASVKRRIIWEVVKAIKLREKLFVHKL